MEENNSKIEVIEKKKIKIRNMLVIIVLAVFAIITFIDKRAEYLKIKEIGEQYVNIFFSDFYREIVMFAISFVITYIIFYINNNFIKRGLKKFAAESSTELPKLPNKSICLIAAIISGTFINKFLYESFLMMSNATWFGKVDSLFGKDIGFYMFVLPFIKNVIIYSVVFFLILMIYTAIYYVIAINVCFKEGVNFQSLKKNTFIKQIETIVMIFTILMSLYIVIIAQDIQTGEMISIKNETSTALVGAGLSDVSIKLWGYRILAVVIFFSVIFILKNLNKGQFKKAIKTAIVTPVYLVLMFVVLIYFQEVYVGSSELDKEKVYIGYNIENTKDAYEINVEQQILDEYDTITKEEIEENADVITNIPMLKDDIVVETVTNMQDNSTYYTYENVNLSWKQVNGKNRLFYILAREMLSDRNRSYNNDTYEYTHGYSIVVTSATDVDKNGYVEMIQSDFESSKFDAIEIVEPRIYFGLETDSLIIVNSKYGEEFDYPLDGLKYETNTYKGEAGLNVGFIDRCILGIANANYGMVFSGNITEDTKVITTRNILDRAKTLLPYIKYDENPYLVVTDEGRLVWVIDGYTTSNNYPYSQTTTLINKHGYKENINYIRNSVKVLVDAYDGTTTFYITDRNDPIIMMYSNLYPDLFSKKEIPEDIKEQFRYSQYLFDIQAGVIATYHDISEDMLYRADDLWSIATIDGEEKIESTHTVLKQKDSEKVEFGIVVPYSKYGKESLTGYLVGTYKDGKPTLSLYKFPSGCSVAGITQFNTLVEEDEVISKEIESIDVSGTKLVRNTMIVPINDTLLYVETIHQERLNEPETKALKKVIVSSGNKVAIGNTLEEAILNLLSENKSYLLDFIDMEDINQVIDSIIEANNNLQESIEAGDLEMIGKDIETLKTLIDQLETLKNQENENFRR